MNVKMAKRFNLIDAVVLVCAAGVGLALARETTAWERAPARDAIANYAVSQALMWTLAILVLNVTRYRATRPELACRPGVSAGLAILIERFGNFLYVGALYLLGNPFLGFSPPISLSFLTGFLSQTMFGCVANAAQGISSTTAVGAVWLFAAMAGCWRPEKTWVDRTGRVLGVFWLLVTVAYWLSVWVFPDPPIPPIPSY